MDQGSRHILLVSYYLPSRWHGGGLRLLDMYTLIRKIYPKSRLHLVSAKSEPDEKPEAEVKSVFDSIHVLASANFNSEGFVSAGLLLEKYDVVDLQYLQSGQFIHFFQKAGAGRVIFSPMESMVRSMGSIFHDFSFSRPGLSKVGRNFTYACRELSFVFKADRVLCVSDGDARVLRHFRWWGGVSAIETGVSPLEFPESLDSLTRTRRLDGTKRVVFVAFFGSATNMEALTWFLREVHPIVLTAIPDYRFEIIGRGLVPGHVGGNRVDVVGEVSRIEPHLAGAWLGIAPALSGAGLRGKINQYAVAGLPCVASALAAEGLAYRDNDSICLASDAMDFAKHCIRLLSYPHENMEMGLAARRICLENYVWEAKTSQVSEMYGEAQGSGDQYK